MLCKGRDNGGSKAPSRLQVGRRDVALERERTEMPSESGDVERTAWSSARWRGTSSRGVSHRRVLLEERVDTMAERTRTLFEMSCKLGEAWATRDTSGRRTDGENQAEVRG